MSDKNEELDYRKMGIRCGVEMHQQLAGKKLFCDCPTDISEDDEPHTTVNRKLRAVVGETGAIDEAAAQEQAKSKTYAYRAYPDTCCLVELDEEPPHLMNQQALYTTLQMAQLLNADTVDEVQIMRKTVVDGSNTTGFQRTALVARNGKLVTSEGDVHIPSIAVEEDAAKIISRTATEDTYNLSRLGIPLIEIGTDPDIISPEHCQEVAAQLGMMLRSTGRVKRGLGTIRQDVNVSIKGGSRVEIKGAQDLAMIPTLVKNEAIRQQNILSLKLTTKTTKYVAVSDIFDKTKCKFIAKARSSGMEVAAVPLPQMAGRLGLELQPGKRLGSDVSDFAKVKTGIGGIIHSDEDPKKYHFSSSEIALVRKRLKLSDEDAFVMIVGTKEQCTNGFIALFMRLKMLANGVPKEVRKANDDGTTTYLRPMPGAARMYPETDTLPIDVKDIEVDVPELIEKKIRRYQKEYGLSEDLAALTAKGNDWELFEHAIKGYKNLKPASIAESLSSVPQQLKRKHKLDIDISRDTWIELFQAAEDGSFSLNNAIDAIVYMEKKGSDATTAIAHFKLMPAEEVEDIVKKVVDKNKDAPFGAIMGQVMQETRGKADGKLVSDLVREYMTK